MGTFVRPVTLGNMAYRYHRLSLSLIVGEPVVFSTPRAVTTLIRRWRQYRRHQIQSNRWAAEVVVTLEER